MTRAVRGCTGTHCLPTLAIVFRLAAKRPLIDAARLGSREGHAHVFQLENRLGAFAAHVFDGVLVADIVRTLDRVVHVPTPIVVGIVAADRAGNAALGGHGMRARRKYLGNDRSFQPGLSELQRRTQPGPTATDDDPVKFHLTYSRHALS